MAFCYAALLPFPDNLDFPAAGHTRGKVSHNLSVFLCNSRLQGGVCSVFLRFIYQHRSELHNSIAKYLIQQ